MKKAITACLLFAVFSLTVWAKDDGAKATLDAANALYKERSYKKAATKFQAYLKAETDGDQQGMARYRLGECLMKEGKKKEAIKEYTVIVDKLPLDKYVAPAAYRLASIHYNKKEYAAAVSLFDIAEHSTNKKQIQLSAGYYGARSLQLSKQPKKALAAYERLIERKVKRNAYRDTAKLAAAKLHIELKQLEKARAYLEELASEKNSDKGIREKAEEQLESLESKD